MILCCISISGISEKIIATLISTIIIAIAKKIVEHKNNRQS